MRLLCSASIWSGSVAIEPLLALLALAPTEPGGGKAYRNGLLACTSFAELACCAAKGRAVTELANIFGREFFLGLGGHALARLPKRHYAPPSPGGIGSTVVSVPSTCNTSVCRGQNPKVPTSYQP